MPLDPAHDSAASFASASVGKRHRGLGRWLGRLSLAVLLAPVVVVAASEAASMLPGPRLLDVHYNTIIWLVLGAVFVAPGLAALSAIATSLSFPPASRATLTVDGDGLLIQRRWRATRIPRRGIVDGLVVPGVPLPAVELHLTGGRVLRAEVDSEEIAHEVLERLGIAPEQRRVAVALGTPNRELAGGCLAFPIAMLVAFTSAILLASVTSTGLPIVWASIVLAITLLVRRLARPGEVVIGTEGVRIRRLFRDRFVPFSAIVSASAAGGALTLDVEGADGFEKLTVNHADKGLLEGLAARIREALERRRPGDDARATSEALEPCGRGFAEWRAAIGKLVAPGAQYRRAPITAEDLYAVLEDPGAPPKRRIGAAVGLRASAHPAAHERIRIAAEGCADEGVRLALEAAAEEELDEAPIRRFVEAEEPRAFRGD